MIHVPIMIAGRMIMTGVGAVGRGMGVAARAFGNGAKSAGNAGAKTVGRATKKGKNAKKPNEIKGDWDFSIANQSSSTQSADDAGDLPLPGEESTRKISRMAKDEMVDLVAERATGIAVAGHAIRASQTDDVDEKMVHGRRAVVDTALATVPFAGWAANATMDQFSPTAQKMERDLAQKAGNENLPLPAQEPLHPQNGKTKGIETQNLPNPEQVAHQKRKLDRNQKPGL